MTIKRLAILSVHTSPLATLGGNKTGGMNVYVRELAREFGAKGILVDVFTRRSSHDQPEIDTSLGENVRVIHLVAGAPLVLDPMDVYPHLSHFTAGVIAFATKHEGLTYDMIYSNYWLSGWVAHKLNEVWGTPFAHMYHTLGHMKNRIASTPPILPDVRITVETQIANWANRLIAATPAEYSQLLWLYRADRRKIAVIPPGVDAQRFRPMSQMEAKACVGMSTDDQLLLFVGRIEPLKAVDSIIEAINLIRQQHPDSLRRAKLAIIGGNSGNAELSRLMSLTDDLGLSDVVEFLGAKDQSTLSLYYTAATAVIMPSDYESFGMVALEAMSSGTPVIASEVGGLAFLIQDKETGYLVPVREPAVLAERIHTLLVEPETRQRLGHNAAEAAKAYTWQNIANRLVKEFEDIIAERKPRRRLG